MVQKLLAEEAQARSGAPIEDAIEPHGSVLRHLVGEELITGVMVPWLYLGSCISALCWCAMEFPPEASEILEAAIKDGLLHLFEAGPSLLYQLAREASKQC
ncbi:hypothetical protein WJX73_009559 [Symbiochloris irregularis]|uniref:Uncharacterized protein n=1 Tax=Symbiochloris irregularis TaxID=706552 RepID=A0AAW1NZ91_9CHLO